MRTIDLVVLVTGMLINSVMCFLAGHLCGRGEVFEDLWHNVQLMSYEDDEDDEIE